MTETPERTYLKTHAWIDFRLDLQRASPEFWMLLGEARSKVHHVAGSLLNPEVARELHEVYLAKGVLATTAIEGNTLSEEDARALVDGTLKLPPSQQYLGTEMDNIIAAFNGIKNELVAGPGRPLSPALLAEYNETILAELELDPGVVPGEIPDYSVTVGRYLAAPREDCAYLLDRLCDWLNGEDFVPPNEDWTIPYAVLKAIMAHLYFAWIHPYGDGNGRTARLVELRVLLEAGVPTPSAHVLSNHYNLTRADYYRHLDQASRTAGGVLAFVEYAVRGFVDGLREQLAMIRVQQFSDRWGQYVYQSFGDAKSATERRQRMLVLELSKHDGPIPKSQLRRLSVDLLEAYGGKTEKTVTRDVNALIDRGLIARRPEGLVPRRSLVEAFLPVAAEQD